MVTMDRAIALITEFVADVDAVGIDHVEEDWPDLASTYQDAVKFLDDAGVK